ncbi:MAG: hypothetical protein Q4G71_03785 [Pseudomonadota bacterium]|nr:hypothetical protein [Pseudomonadota bacterium]
MGFAPFDTRLIVDHLARAVPALQTIGGAADYAAVKELRGFRTPSAYVIFAEERNTGKVPHSVGVCAQEAHAEFGVVLALRHYREARGEQMQGEARALIGQVRAALIGHKPAYPGARVLGWQRGGVLDYDAGVLLFADYYELHHVMQRGAEVAPCAARS